MANAGDLEHEGEVRSVVGTIRCRAVTCVVPCGNPECRPGRHWTVRAELAQL